jgi:hypothetical protein
MKVLLMVSTAFACLQVRMRTGTGPRKTTKCEIEEAITWSNIPLWYWGGRWWKRSGTQEQWKLERMDEKERARERERDRETRMWAKLERKDRLYIARGEGIRVIAGKNTIRIGLMLMMYALHAAASSCSTMWNTLDSCAPLLLLLLLAAAAGLLLLLACTRKQQRGTCLEESLQCFTTTNLVSHHTTCELA